MGNVMDMPQDKIDYDSMQPEVVAPLAHREATVFPEVLLGERASERAPLIVVGLPRSGSSSLSDVLSQTGIYYVFDDLYLYREVQRLNAFGPLSEDQLDKLLFFLGWQIRARIRFKPYAVPQMLQEDVDRMNEGIKAAFSGKTFDWSDLQREWLYRITLLNGSEHWGYNMPGAFRNLDYLIKVYPECRILFLFRDPNNVLSSYKHIKDHRDGDYRRYHPVVYAVYWMRSVSTYFRFKKQMPDRVAHIRFEDMVADADMALAPLADFLGVEAVSSVKIPAKNTSFSKGRKALNGVETALLNLVAGTGMRDLGYAPQRGRMALYDLVELMLVTGRFVRFKIEAILSRS